MQKKFCLKHEIFIYLLLIIIIIIIRDRVLLCRLGWSAGAPSRPTASSASQVHDILPQPPK